jgi:hypothetical protein
MAILILGQSLCALCSCPLLADEPTTALPAIADTTHSLYAYFDSGFHQVCFAQWVHRKEALAAVSLDRMHYEASPAYQLMAAKFGKLGKGADLPS